MEVCNIAQEAVTETIPKKKKFKKTKWLSEQTLQILIPEERTEAKGKGEEKLYPTECRVPENSKER